MTNQDLLDLIKDAPRVWTQSIVRGDWRITVRMELLDNGYMRSTVIEKRRVYN